MVSVYTCSTGMPDEERRQIVYGGGLILFKNVEEVLELVPYIRELAEEAFSPHDPQIAHQSYDRQGYLERVEDFQRTVTNSPVVRDGFLSALSRLGVELDRSGFSRFTMRVQPPANSHIDRNTAALGAHRDSWYSQDFAQTNWWTPWYPLEKGRNLRFYPKYWLDPMPNSSEGWSLDEFRAARVRVTAAGGSFDEILDAYPPVRPERLLRDEEALDVMFEPGDLLNFSLAHLHQGPPNTTRLARFSTDFRTMHAHDVAEGLGAPNVDSKSTGSGIGDFKRLSDEKPLARLVHDLELASSGGKLAVRED